MNTPIARTLKCDQHTWQETIEAWLTIVCALHISPVRRIATAPGKFRMNNSKMMSRKDDT